MLLVLWSAVVVVVMAAGAAALPAGASSALKKEHKSGAELVLPDTASIPGQRLGEWDVDKFFSLWYIFALSDNVEVSKKPYTVLAPSNEAFDRVKLEPGFSGRNHIVNILRNHIILGRVITAEGLKQLQEGGELRLTTLLGTTAVFSRKGDALFVNGTAIIGDVIEIKNASIVRTTDYLPLPDHLAATSETELPESPLDGSGVGPDTNDLDASATISNLPLLNEVGEIYSEAELSPSFATHNQRLQIPPAGKDSFVEAIEDALSLLKSGVGVFQGYFYEANITAMFSKEKEYTLLLPVNEAFQRYYPIDWGFNPFVVKDFTRETIINHFVPGKLISKDITDGMRVKTLGGKELVFERVSNELSVNGHKLFLGDTPISHGNILFLDELLFVNYRIVEELRAQHRDKETGPPLAGVAAEAEFLAHLISFLVNRDHTTTSTTAEEGEGEQEEERARRYNRFAEYVTFGFDNISKHMSADHKYTIFVLDDAAVTSALGADPDREFLVDPFVVDAPLREEMLLGHLVAKRLYLHDLRDGATIETLDGHKLSVSVKNGTTYINEARLYPRQEHVYNLGNILFLDSFPTFTTEQLRERAAAIFSEGSGLEVSEPPRLDLGLEGVEWFAGELGSPEGMIRQDGDSFSEEHLLETGSSGRPDV